MSYSLLEHCVNHISDSYSRRCWLRSVVVGVLAPSLSALPSVGWAGRQVEEPLSDSIRSVLQRQIARSSPPELVFSSRKSKDNYLQWFSVTSARLQRYIRQESVRSEFLQTVWYEAQRAGLDVSLVLGLIQVESAFRKHAVSVMGALGYMQIMPFWSRLIGDGDVSKLFVMQTNMRFGNVILRHYLNLEKGNLFMALGRYNGSRGRAAYPNAVFAAQKRWLFTDSTALEAKSGPTDNKV